MHPCWLKKSYWPQTFEHKNIKNDLLLPTNISRPKPHLKMLLDHKISTQVAFILFYFKDF